ncbi:hypothetical protein LEP1GSC045_0549 [Leptospira interrogans serovar Pomona str. Kennewicki LC82-25]|nr:hypothetical protein LEP1GSC045_0549 [Leptospira interrogans serovar Pomona str. Kennewicki LC82-25]EKN96025.1 hypothetical protein LEP1GSC014_4317 [Leptospira interrogans serovar Pomona str. Pomona]EMF34627.1 hypothetical protein LEP1GSC201_3806 [Leptospira interrogans serovar Pomona str. Fox 32256]EMI65642.1 hypothetical protein LEP1GSC200_2107 [Leptospira interrogans serovar Pomona str. CSL10083]EMJ60702.1 hypothetical protein LEP1GSC197_1451 [Leptospira interrogans serovar Pomona str. CS
MGTDPHFIITDSESNSFYNRSELQNFTTAIVLNLFLISLRFQEKFLIRI